MESKKIKILITGASGFIGHCLASKLIGTQSDVIYTYNSNKLLEKKAIAIKKNLLKESLFDSFIAFNPDIVIHCAGLNPSVLFHEKDDLFYRFNRDATLQLAQDFIRFCSVSKNQHLKKFINLTTYEIYGNIKKLKGFNESAITNPLNAYAESKAQAVNELDKLNCNNVLFTNVVCTNNYGPRQSIDKLIPAVYNKLIHNNEITIHGDGSSQRTWTYVSDTCEGIKKIIERGNCKRYHLSSNDHISVIGVINSMHNLLKSKNLITTSSAKLNWRSAVNNPIFKINSNRSQEQLKWNVKTPFLNGLEQTIQHLSTYKNE